MFRIAVEIQGSSPLLLNRFTEKAQAQVSAGSSSAITVSAKGTPREQAGPKLYLTPKGEPMVPGPNVYRGIIDAGIYHKAGRSKITTQKSSLVCAGMSLEDVECAILDPFKGGSAAWEVDSRSVVNPATGGRMMCHRPRFDAWKIGFTLLVDDKIFDETITRALVDDMGIKIGLGDYRPARKGPFGRFLVTLWKRQSEVRDVSKAKYA